MGDTKSNGSVSGKDGKQDGVVVGYQENGQLWMKGAVKGRNTEWDGPCEFCHRDGTVDEEKTGTYRTV